MKKIIILLLIAVPMSIFGQSYDNADAVYKTMKHEFILNDDGSTEYIYSHEQKLLTPYAVNRLYGESFIIYNPDYQELEIIRSVTTMADGRKVQSPLNAYNEVLPRFAINSANYMGLREMVVTHTGLEIGAVIDFEYKLKSNADFMPGLMGKVLAGERSPIENLEIVISIPGNSEFAYKWTKAPAEPEITSQNGRKTYKWNLKKIPLIDVETNQPGMPEIVPVLMFSTANEVRSYLTKNLDEKLKLGKEAKWLVDEIISGELDDAAKAIKLRDHLLEATALMNCDLSYLGYKYLPANETFEQNSGSELDRAVLLSAMLDHAGIENDILLFADFYSEWGLSKFLTQFQIPMVRFQYLGSHFVLDPNAVQNFMLPEKILEKPYFVLTATESGVYSAPQGAAIQTMHINIGKNRDLSVNYKLLASERYAPGITSADKMNKAKAYLNQSGYIIEKENPTIASGEADLNISLNLSMKKLPKSGEYTELSLPAVPNSPYTRDYVLNRAERTTPVIAHAADESLEFIIDLPQDSDLVFVPKNVKIENKAGSFHFEIERNEEKVIIRKSLLIEPDDNGLIYPENYKDFLELISHWQSEKYNNIYIK